MEVPIREARARLSELIIAARKGERVIITRDGHPAAELLRCDRRGGIDFDKLEAVRRRLGIQGDGEGWPGRFNDPAFSREVLGLSRKQLNRQCVFCTIRPACSNSWTGRGCS